MGRYALSVGLDNVLAAEGAPTPKVTRRRAESGRDYPVEFLDGNGQLVSVGTAQASPDATEVITDNRLLIDVPDGTLVYGDFDVQADGVAELHGLVIRDAQPS